MVACGYELYGSYAVNLAKSVRAYEPSIKIALIHDNKAIQHLTESEKSLFDILTVADPADYTIAGKTQYQRMKLCAYKYSPFESTLYIDVDTLWFPNKPISEFIDHLKDKDFYIGKNGDFDPIKKKNLGSNYTFWGEPLRISKYFRLRNLLPQTISGVFWFKKSDFAEKIFNRALQVYADPKAPTQKWANGKADEYCFNVALSEANYQQGNVHIVYFDKANGNINRETVYLNFWGIAAGGNQLSPAVRSLYEDLVDLYDKALNCTLTRRCPDKIVMIAERRNF